jgi:hypothetical protein
VGSFTTKRFGYLMVVFLCDLVNRQLGLGTPSTHRRHFIYELVLGIDFD